MQNIRLRACSLTFLAILACYFVYYYYNSAAISRDGHDFETLHHASDITRIPLSYDHAAEYFQALDYAVCEHQSAVQRARGFFMHLRRPINEATCAAVFSEFLATYKIAPEWPPPRQIPEHLRVKNASWYFAERFDGGGGAHWSPAYLQPYLDIASDPDNASKAFTYGENTRYIYKVLELFPLAGQTGLVVGSAKPWLEAILLSKGKVAKLLTLEYLSIVSTVPQIEYISPVEYSKNWTRIRERNIDFAFTFSSLEHSGLGRFGDRLDPEGDLKELLKLSCVLRDGAFVFLGIPTAIDTIFWNAHRMYGRWRLPLITANFNVLGLYTNDGHVDGVAFANGTVGWQAIVVMRNAKTGVKCNT